MASEKKVVILDYQLGNLFSVNQALVNIGLNTIISSDPSEIEQADALVLPGVGAFADAMNNLQSMKLIGPIKNFVASGKPFLGICLGLQLLFSESEEFGVCKGLNLIEGKVKKFPKNNHNGERIKVPQIAWNRIFQPESNRWVGSPLYETKDGDFFYFVHSFYVIPNNKEVVLSSTNYEGINYASSIYNNNIFACQFHPEKSATEGLKIYKNWARLNNLLF